MKILQDDIRRMASHINIFPVMVSTDEGWIQLRELIRLFFYRSGITNISVYEASEIFNLKPEFTIRILNEINSESLNIIKNNLII